MPPPGPGGDVFSRCLDLQEVQPDLVWIGYPIETTSRQCPLSAVQQIRERPLLWPPTGNNGSPAAVQGVEKASTVRIAYVHE